MHNDTYKPKQILKRPVGEIRILSNMQYKVPIGVDNFSKLINPKFGFHFVDKSLFIKELLDDPSEVILITRPRRWGKTLNMSMLEHFFAPTVRGNKTAHLFDSLAITQINHGQYMSHQGQHPVIFLSFKDIKQPSLEHAVESLKILLQRTYRTHDYLMDSELLSPAMKRDFKRYKSQNITNPQLEQGLLFLSECLSLHYQKSVYILIDEYDTPLNIAYQHGYVDSLTGIIKNLLSAALKGNPYLEKGVMTGILRISKDSLLSGLNNVKVFSVLSNHYTSSFGFTENEVRELFLKSGVAYDLEAIRQYYNGYKIGDVMLYNPWSIICCLSENGQLSPYWVNTADDHLLKQVLVGSSDQVKERMQSLLNNLDSTVDEIIPDTIRFEKISTSDQAVWGLLLATGYLTSLEHRLQGLDTWCQLTIPNQEVKALYTSIFRNWLRESITEGPYRLFMEDLIHGRVEIFTKKLEQYLLTYGSSHDFNRESNYHTFMLGLFCGLTEYYELYSNMEAGLGRADMVLVPRNTPPHLKPETAIVLEFKYDPRGESAIDGLLQIDHKQYAAFLGRYPSVQRILKIGIGFSGKTVQSAYRCDPAV